MKKKMTELQLLKRALKIAKCQNETMEKVLWQIADNRRRTRDAMLAKSCLEFILACEREARKNGYAKGSK